MLQLPVETTDLLPRVSGQQKEGGMMSFKDELQTKIINARDAAMQVPLQKFRCSWCGHPVPQGTTFCSPACIDWFNISPEEEDNLELLRLPRLGKIYEDNPRRPQESVKAYSNRLYHIQHPAMAKMPKSAVSSFTKAVEADGGEVFKYEHGIVYFSCTVGACRPEHVDANQKGCDEETLEPHQRQEHWEE
jgi:predicted nucleic acid-binding Zn ribbon protein